MGRLAAMQQSGKYRSTSFSVVKFICRAKLLKLGKILTLNSSYCSHYTQDYWKMTMQDNYKLL